jgi:hypothetical protein
MRIVRHRMKIATTVALRVCDTEFVELSEIERFEDGSGFCSQIRVGSDEFICTGRRFYFDDLPKFLSDLRRMYQKVGGTAELRQRYEAEFVKFEMSARGQIKVTGLLRDYGAMERVFQFGFEADQSFLPPYIKGLENVLKELES